MLDYAEELRHHGKKTALEAAFEAGKRRIAPDLPHLGCRIDGRYPDDYQQKRSLGADGNGHLLFGTLTSMVLLVLFLSGGLLADFPKHG